MRPSKLTFLPKIFVDSYERKESTSYQTRVIISKWGAWNEIYISYSCSRLRFFLWSKTTPKNERTWIQACPGLINGTTTLTLSRHQRKTRRRGRMNQRQASLGKLCLASNGWRNFAKKLRNDENVVNVVFVIWFNCLI